ncbi:hypothetical protein GGI04_000623 [Coemansia thaxteri]|uniref:Glutathione S-transferase n=1 Tax=Coemansia thaxteri TaxID=2663907 RepID=A0A9W8BFA0_9FUNG|nr:hypothetical protein H4R26_004239 [Coemansia thaxteri]KAJ2009243.1 hypothetical protein GGI04_000623 [Coemansia thaxteri]KAJ2473176.1 hypothetical protein EV174_005738 [Coemansia sp. RSA 2320]KAJ2474168.1 hypothetical protein GGI02_000295 [Coemansia sp. RSA 2322]
MEGSNGAPPPSALPLPGAVKATSAVHIAHLLAHAHHPSAEYRDIAAAAAHIWQVGLQCPGSGLVPSSDCDQITVLQFVAIWTTRVLPRLLLSPEAALSSSDLAALSRSIAARRRGLKRRGPFWNGRALSIAEVVVAPFADDILHGALLPDSPEYAALATWLAAIRAAPVVSQAAACSPGPGPRA